jgi:plasmid maintenance system antidote protein VapI
MPRDIRLLDDKEVVRLLRLKVERAGGQKAWAKKARINRTMVNKVINGQRPLTPGIIRALRLRKVYTTVRNG